MDIKFSSWRKLPDIKTKLQSIKNLNEGINFSKLPSKIVSQKFEKEEYEENIF